MARFRRAKAAELAGAVDKFVCGACRGCRLGHSSGLGIQNPFLFLFLLLFIDLTFSRRPNLAQDCHSLEHAKKWRLDVRPCRVLPRVTPRR